MLLTGEISGSHSSKCEDDSFLVLCSLIVVDRCFRGSYCLHHQGHELLIATIMEAVHISEMLVCFYESPRCHIPVGCHLVQTCHLVILLDLYLGDDSHCNSNGCLASLAYFPKIKVGLSNHQSVCLCVLVSIIMMMMSMWRDHVSELCPPTGLLFIPKVIDI
jgi:hypothetical protein